MRYLSLLAVLALMFWSWTAIKTPLSVPELTHINIQQDIKIMIEGTIYKQLPTATNFKFDRFWTRSEATNEIVANFLFSFENSAEKVSPARYGVEGSATLKFNPESRLWDVEGFRFVNNEIVFKDGVTFTPTPGDGE
jgi:hypothetical protein